VGVGWVGGFLSLVPHLAHNRIEWKVTVTMLSIQPSDTLPAMAEGTRIAQAAA